MYHCQYSSCAYFSASCYNVRKHISNFCYREHCTEEEKAAVGEEEKSASVQSHEWNRWIEESEVPGTADELKEGRKLEIGRDLQRSVQGFRSIFVDFAVRLTTKSGRNEIQTLTNIIFDVFLTQKSFVST